MRHARNQIEYDQRQKQYLRRVRGRQPENEPPARRGEWRLLGREAHEIDKGLLCFVVVALSVHDWFTWFIYPYTSGLLHWHWGNHMIAPVPVKQP